MNPRISLTMIVKNEADNLGDCLEHIKHEVDEIIIVDTGSTDETVSIALRYTTNVFNFTWNGDFSAARNFALQHADGDWILSLDADEIVQCEPNEFRFLISNAGDNEAFLLPLLNPISDSTGEFNTFYVLRLFKNNNLYQYFGKIHEQVSIQDPQKVGLAHSPIIEHKSIPLKTQHQKRYRNLQLLKNAIYRDPDNPFLQYYLGVEWLMLGKAAYALPFLQKSNLRLDDESLLFRTPALKYLILCLKTLGQLDEALILCLEAGLKYPSFTDIFYLGGLLLEEKKEYLIALKWFDQALQCGTPPALINHQTGSDSFLAQYHLGFCYEKLGKNTEAKKAYEAALDLNPRYSFPLYPFFQILLNEKGPSSCYKILEDHGYLDKPILCLTSANLFYISDHVNEAFHCLETHRDSFQGDDRFFLDLGKYCIYSGRSSKGLSFLRKVSGSSSSFISAQTLSIIALILLGNLKGAKSLAITLWQDPLTRCEGYIFLSLIGLIKKGTLIQFPPIIREQKTLSLVIDIYQDYLHYCDCRSFPKSRDPYVNSWGQALETVLMSSEEGLNYLFWSFDYKVRNIKQLFAVNFGKGWVSDEH
jgi:glycosyltransferase involved in cell wall biosynthesis